ncbi:hypothetical protein ACHAWF_008693 [Thalassiosira exigua]
MAMATAPPSPRRLAAALAAAAGTALVAAAGDAPFVATPLRLLALSLFVGSLLASHLLSGSPSDRLGEVGRRGRRGFAWNESRTGGRGGTWVDGWLFGGSAWVRFGRAVWDSIAGRLHDGQSEGTTAGGGGGGENVFACFGVSAGDEAKADDDGDDEGDDGSARRSASGGIWGYDPVLGAHGPLVLAPLRASILLLAWCSVCRFLIATREELVAWSSSPNAEATASPSLASLAPLALRAASAIRRALTSGDAALRDLDAAVASLDPRLGVLPSAIAYAVAVVVASEVVLYATGQVLMKLGIYVPRGVSHPGGPRARKIPRAPRWKEGRTRVLPTELVEGWRCAVASDAHRDTLAAFEGADGEGPKPTMTGEAFGRQIWTPRERRPPAGAGEGGTEDELGAALKAEFGAEGDGAEVGSDGKEGEGKRSEGEGGEVKPKDEEPAVKQDKQGDPIGDFFQNLLSPDRKKPPRADDGDRDRQDPLGEIGGFIQNLFSPDKPTAVAANGRPSENGTKAQVPPKERADDDDDGATKRAALIRTLASGGRTPLAFDPSKNPNSSDQVFRAHMIASYLDEHGELPEDVARALRDDEDGGERRPSVSAKEAARRGVAFYSLLQTSDGHWGGDYGGPHFLLPGLVAAWYVMGRPARAISPAQGALMLRYLRSHQQEDGGWGTHVESPSTMFGTVMSYLAARLLGAGKDEGWVKEGREFIEKEGGAVMTSSWAKFWLCLVGCMDWKGHNSVPPEMWLLPNWFPFHPGRLWCHCRMVYLPMGYLYGSRFVYSEAETDPLIGELREELYCQPYHTIDWDRTRHLVAPMDNYSPIPAFMKFTQNCLSAYENWAIFRPFRDVVRKAGLKFCLEYMKAEDLQTNYIDIGPVNKALNMVSAFHAAGGNVDNPEVRSHMMRVPDYLWVAEDGMKMQGYNGSQCWDTSFAIQAVWECGLLDKFPMLSAKVWAYLERTQILSTNASQSSPAYEYESCDNRQKFYRHVSKGGWPFSTGAHGWPISDCTGEGLKGILALMDSPVVMNAVKKGVLNGIGPNRLYDAGGQPTKTIADLAGMRS